MLDTRRPPAARLAADQARHIRDTHTLLRANGRAAGLSAQAIEALLAAGAFESAALALLGPDVGFMLSRGPDGVSLATLIAPMVAPASGCGPNEREITGQGRTPALALTQALRLMVGLGETPVCLRDGGSAALRVPVLH